jgi:hypothetical protein
MDKIESKMEKFRKEIHLPKQILKDLKLVAAHADKSVKKYMEDIILNDIKLRIEKISKNGSPLTS